jgi:hypothetical protein
MSDYNYLVISNFSLTQLQEYVNIQIKKDGYIPVGGICISYDSVHKQNEYHQALYKPDPKRLLDRISKFELEEAVLEDL